MEGGGKRGTEMKNGKGNEEREKGGRWGRRRGDGKSEEKKEEERNTIEKKYDETKINE